MDVVLYAILKRQLKGFEYMGDYKAGDYVKNSVVKYDGDLYISLNNTNKAPNTDDWELLLVKGPKGDKGDKGDVGPQGPKGDTGPQGPKGDKGDGGVVTVNNKAPNASGNVTLVKGDLDLGNVDNVKQASKAEFNAHLADDAPHQYGNRFEWRYNSATDSLDLVVIE